MRIIFTYLLTHLLRSKAIPMKFCFILLCSVHFGYSQTSTTLYGNVSGLDGQPIPGVSIIVNNSTKGTATDFDGNYEIPRLSSGDEITVSSVGLVSQSYTVKGNELSEKWDIILQEDLLSLSEIVITGTSNPRSKIESSVAITTINAKEIDARLPRSNADLLKAIPGLWVETTGGEGPANVWVRGFPQSGGFTFLGLMEDGLPVFQIGYNTLPSPDQFYKVDETLKNIEAIRGGSAPIVMQGAAGAVVNHISKTGGQSFQGLVKASYGPLQGMGRLDVNLGGPISESLTYNLGGFYRRETGIYDYGYAANRGGQFKANIVKKFTNGKLKVYGKFINDNVNLNLQAPYVFRANGDFDEVAGFDLSSDGLGITNDDTEFSYTLPSGQRIDRDQKDGFYTQMFSLGAEIDFDISETWSINDKVRVDNITHNNDAEFVTDIGELDAAVNYTYADGTAVVDPENLNGNGLIANVFQASLDNKYKQLINRLEITNKVEKNAFTFGFETYIYDLETFSTTSLTAKGVRNAPRRINNPSSPVSPLAQDAVIPLAFVSDRGINEADGTETTLSFYISDEWKATDNLRIDAGFRYDHKQVDGNIAVIGGGAFNGTDSFGFVIDGSEPFDDSAGNWAASLGVNYKINDNLGLFGRGSRAYSSIKLGDYTPRGADISALKEAKDREIFQGEIGLKYRGEKTALFGSILYAEVNDAVSPITIPGSAGLIAQNVFLSTRTYSAEIEAQYRPITGLLLKLVTTLQNAEYTDLNFVASDGTIVAGQRFDWAGNAAERVPAISADLATSYTFRKFDISAGVRYYGDRWSTPANNVELGGYALVNAGLSYRVTPNITFSAQAGNLFNTVALVEGNTRGDQFLDTTTAEGTVQIARRTLPRTVLFKLFYRF